MYLSPSTIKTCFIDLDGCLITPKLTRSVPHRIAQYAIKYLNYDVGMASQQCREAYRRNGTNLEGFLREGHAIDPEHYHSFIHAHLPYATYLEKQPELKRILNDLPCAKYVFTNADERHAQKCLAMTDLESCFDGIIGFETLMRMYDGPYTPCKPKHVSMELALAHAKADPVSSLLFDDQPRNIHMGMDCGVRSVLVGESDIVTCEYSAYIPSLFDLHTSLFVSEPIECN